MAICKACRETVDSLVALKIDGKTIKLCEECADRVREAAALAEASEGVMQDMMGFKGRR
jgi:ribosome-binding protein aMBF1 (putative translation factor)